MPATFPASQAEGWADALTLRPAGDPDPEGAGVPRFALLETRGPDPRALLLSTLILTALVSLSIILGRIPSVTRAPQAETVTLLVAPPEPPTLPDISINEEFQRELSTLSPGAQTGRGQASLAGDDEVAVRCHSRPNHALLTWLPQSPCRLNSAEKPAPIPIQPERVVASIAPTAPPAALEAPKPNPGPVLAVSGHDDVGHDLKPAPAAPGLPRVAAADVPKATPEFAWWVAAFTTD